MTPEKVQATKGYILGKDATIITSIEKNTTKAYYDNVETEYNKYGVCLQILEGSERQVALLLDVKQAKSICKSLKMQIKAIKAISSKKKRKVRTWQKN